MTAPGWYVSKYALVDADRKLIAGPFSTREDAIAARAGMEKLYGNYAVYEQPETTAVELPTEPTFGWLITTGGTSLSWWRNDLDGKVRSKHNTWWYAHEVTCFTPATAVPTVAVDKLREIAFAQPNDGFTRRVKEFLDAIDAAAK